MNNIFKSLKTVCRSLYYSSHNLAAFDDSFPGCFDRHRCIFIHIPKAAGTSVCMNLFGYQTGHKKYLDYYYDNPYKTKLYFKFAFVRNPWDRVVSAFHFLKQGGFDQRDKKWADENLCSYDKFDDFVKNWLTPQNIYKKNHFYPQVDFLVDTNGRIKADYVGRLENFKEDFSKIVKILNLSEQFYKSEAKNKSKHKHYTTYYDIKTIKIVSEVYERDIELFNYKFE